MEVTPLCAYGAFFCSLLAALSVAKQVTVSPAYRVQVYSKVAPRLSPAQNWSLRYQFTVAALPALATWNYNVGTIYEWGGMYLDAYGSAGPFPISHYRFRY